MKFEEIPEPTKSTKQHPTPPTQKPTTPQHQSYVSTQNRKRTTLMFIRRVIQKPWNEVLQSASGLCLDTTWKPDSPLLKTKPVTHAKMKDAGTSRVSSCRRTYIGHDVLPPAAQCDALVTSTGGTTSAHCFRRTKTSAAGRSRTTCGAVEPQGGAISARPPTSPVALA